MNTIWSSWAERSLDDKRTHNDLQLRFELAISPTDVQRCKLVYIVERRWIPIAGSTSSGAGRGGEATGREDGIVDMWLCY